MAEFHPGRVTRDQVAAAAAVSPSTVSRALNDSPLIPAATRQRVRAAAAALGYQPNRAARQLAARRSFQIGFAMPATLGRATLQLGYYAEALDAVIRAAEERGYEVTVSLHREGDGSAFDRLHRQVAQKRVDGFLLTGLAQHSRLPAQLRTHGIPFVLLGCRLGAHPAVDYDPAPGARGLCARLVARGARTVCYLAGHQAFSNARDQRRAYLQAFAANGLDVRLELPGDYSIRHSRAVLAAAPEALRCDAICCANDRSAVAVYDACRAHGQVIGHDILVSGFDDDEHARILHPSLSTIRQDRAVAGRAALEVLIELIDDPTQDPATHLIPTSFIGRESL